MNNYHITPRPDGNWAVIGAGNSRPSYVLPTQSTAIEKGRSLARKARGELRIHGMDNRIRESWSYGNDPYPPEG